MTAFRYELVVLDTPDDDLRALIAAPLRAFNQQAAGPSGSRPLCIAVRDQQDQVIGGLWGHTAYGWLFVELLVVPETERGAGLGRRLMDAAEAEATRRGCRGAWLDTFGFQAKEFYEKLGYVEFGRLEDFPAGHARHFFQKRLGTSSAGS